MRNETLVSQAEDALQERLEETSQVRQTVLDRAGKEQWLDVAPMHQTVRVLSRKGRPDAAAGLAARRTETDSQVLAETPPDRAELVSDAETAAPPADMDLDEIENLVLEQIIGTSEIMPVRFVHIGSRSAHPVGRIVFGIDTPNGTGFLVSPNLVMTNHHVLRDPAEARLNHIEFGVFTRADGTLEPAVPFRFDPDRFFMTSPIEELDYTLVAVEPVNESGRSAAEFGALRLLGERGKEQQGQRVNIVHHPQGNPKQVSLRENFLVVSLDQYLHYMSDTMRGSSGSPVFNDEWEVVALHHAGREITGAAEVAAYKEALEALGRKVADDAEVLVNEGARISSVVADLQRRAQAMGPDRRALLEEALSAVTIPTVDTSPGETATTSQVITTPAGTAPVSITINVGTDSAAEVAPTISPRGAVGLELYVDELTSQKSVITAVAYLESQRESKTYLPSAAARRDQQEDYYGTDLIDGIEDDTIDPAEAFDRLSQIQQDSLEIADAFPEAVDDLESLGGVRLEDAIALESDTLYARSRAHLYTWVDLQRDMMLKCVYSDVVIAPEQLLLNDLLVQLGHGELLPPNHRNFRFLNCEHIVPQSWFDEESVPKADLHHLITARGEANNFRSDRMFRELNGGGVVGPDDRPKHMKPAGRRSGSDLFEPSRNKGLVARATLYFLLAHPEMISNDKYPPAELEVLRTWSDDDPPSTYELHRNEAIFEVQKNRNPLIDFPGWVRKVDFTRGFKQ